MASKRTIRAIARELGLSGSSIAAAKADGISPYDIEALRKWKGNRNDYTPRPPVKSSKTAPSNPNISTLTVEEIVEAASQPGLSKREVEAFKARLDVMKAADTLRQQRNELLSRAEIDDRDSRIMHALQGMFRRMESETPALCYGLSTLGEMKDVVKAKIREAQALYADEYSEFWTSYPAPKN